jgi:hypothetical protein
MTGLRQDSPAVERSEVNCFADHTTVTDPVIRTHFYR